MKFSMPRAGSRLVAVVGAAMAATAISAVIITPADARPVPTCKQIAIAKQGENTLQVALRAGRKDTFLKVLKLNPGLHANTQLKAGEKVCVA